MFSSVFWGLVQVSLMHRLGDCIFFPSVVCVSFPGDFVVQDRLLFSPCCELCLLIHFGDCSNSLGSHFGHDRAKNDSGVVSLFKL